MAELKVSLTQEERTGAARRSLVDATIDVLANEGYRGVTFARVGEVAGISRGLIGYHFGTKRALIETVISSIRDNYWQQAVSRAAESREVSGLDALRKMVATYLDRLSRDPRPAKVMLVLGTESMNEHPSIRAAVRDAYADQRRELQAFIDVGQKDGSIRAGVDAVGFAGMFEAVIRGIVLQYLVDPKGFDLAATKAAAEATVSMLAA